MNPVLSLVTGTRNRPVEFARLLKSVIVNTSVSWELLVSDASDEPIECSHPNVRILRESPPQGYVKGYNQAFRQASGEWVIWLNDDAEVLKGYDVTAIEYMKAHPSVGLGCLAFSDRCWADFRVQTLWGIPYANFGIMRREFGNQIGWFWEGLRMYGSDNSITFEVLLNGKGVAAIHGPLIHHYRTEDAMRQQNQAGRREDSRRLTERYGRHVQNLQAAYRRLSA